MTSQSPADPIPGQGDDATTQVLISLHGCLDLSLDEEGQRLVHDAINRLHDAKADPYSQGTTSAEANEAMQNGLNVVAMINNGAYWVGSPPTGGPSLLDYEPQGGGGHDSGYESGYDSGYEADDESGEPEPGAYQGSYGGPGDDRPPNRDDDDGGGMFPMDQ